MCWTRQASKLWIPCSEVHTSLLHSINLYDYCGSQIKNLSILQRVLSNLICNAPMLVHVPFQCLFCVLRDVLAVSGFTLSIKLKLLIFMIFCSFIFRLANLHSRPPTVSAYLFENSQHLDCIFTTIMLLLDVVCHDVSSNFAVAYGLTCVCAMLEAIQKRFLLLFIFAIGAFYFITVKVSHLSCANPVVFL